MSDESRPAERKPLMNKLEPSSSRHGNAFHKEAQEWSKSGRSLLQLFEDIIYWFLGD